jgi:phage shock protein C
MRRGHDLYRIPQEGRIAGVCAGIAEYFNLETWLVRIIVVCGVLFSGFFFVIGYFALWFVLDKKSVFEDSPRSRSQFDTSGRDERRAARKEKFKQSWNEIDEKVRSHFEDRPDFASNPYSSKPIGVKQKVWQAGEPPAQAFRDISNQFSDLEKRLQSLETYVTSPEFTVSREIDRL